jgi:TonB-linked SusC/RagA family outer membrane protein
VFCLGVLCLGGTTPLQAQGTGAVRGTVMEAASRRPLEGAEVFVQGGRLGTVTNASGAYLLGNLPVGQVEIRVRRIGYSSPARTLTITAGDTARLDFELSAAATSLEAVVVTGAGQATQIKKLGNTVASVNVEELAEAPISNLSEALQGREPGVSALPTGGVSGEGTKLRIRGGSSLTQSQEPIIYVDGIRIDNGGGMGGLDQGGGSPSRLDDIDPATIERIEVLKGSAAATLYGTQAANGVIQIFTKKGVAGAPRWTLKLEQGITNYPQDRYKNHAGFARTQEEADRLAEYWGIPGLQAFQPFEVDMWPRMFETGHFGDYSLSVNGGSDRITYFVSGRYLGEDGPFRNDGFGPAAPGMELVTDANRKRQASVNLNFSPTDKLQVRANSMYIDSYMEVPDNNNNIAGTLSNLINSKPERANATNPSGSVPSFGSMREMMNRHTQQGTQHFAGSIGLHYSPMEAVNLESTFGIDQVNEQNVRFIPYGWNVDHLASGTPEGTRTLRDRTQRQITFDTKASWNDDLTSRVSSGFVLGVQAFLTQASRAGGTGARFAGPGLEVISAGADPTVFEQRVNQVAGGVFAQEQLGWDNYLFVTLGGRYDKHSAFGESAGGAFYPKFSVSLVPSDMPFWNSTTLSQLRLRAAIGKSGLQPSAFAKFTTFNPVTSATGAGVAPSNLGNPDLKPEVSTEIEGGFDLGFLENRIALTATYWRRDVRDLLVNQQFPLSGGFQNPQLVNAGEMTSHGLELGLNGQAFATRTASLDFFVNGAYLKQTVTSLGSAPPIKPGYFRYGNWIREGYAPGAFFGPVLAAGEYPIDTDGDGQSDTREQLLGFFAVPRSVDAIRTVLEPGIDGDPLLHYLGKPMPDWAGAFGGTLSFLGRFRLSTTFEYKAGLQVHNLTDEFRRSNASIGRNIIEAATLEATIMNPASTAEQRVDAARRWGTEMAALSPQDRLNAIEDADFVRWRELSLSYDVPGSVIDRIGMGSMTLTLAGRNIALWTKYGGIDPELNVIGGRDPSADQESNNFISGVDGWGFAIPRRITFSAALGF